MQKAVRTHRAHTNEPTAALWPTFDEDCAFVESQTLHLTAIQIACSRRDCELPTHGRMHNTPGLSFTCALRVCSINARCLGRCLPA